MTIHSPPQDAEKVLQWYKRAQIDYHVHFLELYIAYNAWYREVSGSTNDREAIGTLKKRFVIWDDYMQGKTLQTLAPYLERLVELSQRTPFPSTQVYWDGVIQTSGDWRSLIEFWYQVRCMVVHGSQVPRKHVWYAYETLNIFMEEIVSRMHKSLMEFQAPEKQAEVAELAELSELPQLQNPHPQRSARFRELQQKLYLKFIASPDIWQVDMRRVEGS